MKFLSLMIAIAAIAGISYFIYLNLHNNAIVMCPFQHVNFEISIAHLAAIMFMGGAIAGVTFSAFNYAGRLDSLKAYKKKHEKMSVQSDSDETRIKALEEKIKTLEVALDNALKNQE